MPWLAPDFVHPTRVDLACGYHLRPIAAEDVELDFPAVMGSRDRLWAIYGEAWGWPPATMTVEQDREDLAHHAAEIEAHESFNYAVLDQDESRLVGCVYLDPARDSEPDVDAVVSWWVVDDLVGSELDHELGELVPRWLTETWGFTAPRIGV
jgi:RimJ/RimL family protein N-acetyltransferase